MANVSFEKDAKRDLVKGIIYLLFVILFIEIAALPFIFLLGGGGVEEPLNVDKFQFYIGLGIVAISAFLGIKFARSKITNKKWRKFWDVNIHDPENSVFAKLKEFPVFGFLHKVNKKMILLYMFGLLLFIPFLTGGNFIRQSAIGEGGEGGVLATILPQTSFPDKGFFTEQQVTPSASFFLSIIPASPAETAFDLAVYALVLLAGGYAAFVKGWIPVESFAFIKWGVAPVFSAFNHLLYHIVRYGGDEVSLAAVFLFGVIQAYLYVFTASLVLPFLFHDLTNGILKLFDMGILGSDASKGFVILIWFMILAVFIFTYRGFYVSKSIKTGASPTGA